MKKFAAQWRVHILMILCAVLHVLYCQFLIGTNFHGSNFMSNVCPQNVKLHEKSASTVVHVHVVCTLTLPHMVNEISRCREVSKTTRPTTYCKISAQHWHAVLCGVWTLQLHVDVHVPVKSSLSLTVTYTDYSSCIFLFHSTFVHVLEECRTFWGEPLRAVI